MPDASPSPARKSPKRELLLDTAFKLFYERGFHAVGIDTILAESGVAKMTLYNHFKSKDELIVAALEKRAAEILDHRTATIQEAGDAPLAKIAAIFDAYHQWFHSEGFNGCAFIRAIGEYPDETSPINQSVKRQKQILIDTFAQIATELKAKSPQLLAQQLYLLAEGAIIRAHTFQDPDSALAAKQAALDLAQSTPQT
ncbi:TetR/AcrR family transcriptional regulator [Pelagicoccus mobilis]|uniref:TetR/AcrR family transcriptional regulator n=1 Tax=Pelagicoccus mobilis TaxID=415221 RepID=A0A934S081_9BACT|nr:TetR/AcrR family transcriptional regulator [Pelagicoccus mobilis]MBK1876708.1 TetR/AcrR family transcriptional regulator [Pelagicoccus mobilis]